MDLQGMDRYERNMNTLTPEENRRLADFKVLVVGCGGLGGYIIEMLGRLGIGSIVAVDGDVFDATNLNRQLLSDEGNLGKPKALAARDRMSAVNSSVAVRPVTERFTAENGAELLAGCHLAFDALDKDVIIFRELDIGSSKDSLFASAFGFSKNRIHNFFDKEVISARVGAW